MVLRGWVTLLLVSVACGLGLAAIFLIGYQVGRMMLTP